MLQLFSLNSKRLPNPQYFNCLQYKNYIGEIEHLLKTKLLPKKTHQMLHLYQDNLSFNPFSPGKIEEQDF